MKTAFNFKKLIASTALLTAAMGVSLSAEAGLYSEVSVTLGSRCPGLQVGCFSGYLSNAIAAYNYGTRIETSSGNWVDTGNFNQSFSGFNSTNEPATTTFSGRSYAQSSYGSLKTYATGTLTNTIALNSYNLPYINSDGSENTAGMPSVFNSLSLAYFSDKLTISSLDEIEFIQLELALEGEINSSMMDNSGSFNLSQRNAYEDNPFSVSNFPRQTIFNTLSHSLIDQVILSNPIPVIDGKASFGLFMVSSFSSINHIFKYGDADGLTYSGTSDFSHTLNVASIIGYNAAGQQVNLNSVIGSSGTRYIGPALIPEPASLALLGIGLVGMGWARRRS